jgi:branched-chain amino acid transport system permease protein
MGMPSGRWRGGAVGAIRPLAVLGSLAVLVAAPWILASRYWTSVLILILFKVLLASAVRLNHRMGFVSLGHVGFMMVGAYLSALLVMRAGVSVWCGLAAAAAGAFLLAFLLGYAFLRVKGITFVVLTFLTAETLRLCAGYTPSLTGGRVGLSRIPSLFDEPTNVYLLLLLISAAITLFIARLERSSLGLYWRAIAESEALCAAAGMNTTLVKTVNFSISAAIAGVAGGLWAHYQGVLTPSMSSVFGPMSSIFLLVYVYTGGIDQLAGPAAGAATLIILGELARVSEEYVPIIVGAVMILVVLFLPDGIAGGLARVRLRLVARRGAQ